MLSVSNVDKFYNTMIKSWKLSFILSLLSKQVIKILRYANKSSKSLILPQGSFKTSIFDII